MVILIAVHMRGEKFKVIFFNRLGSKTHALQILGTVNRAVF